MVPTSVRMAGPILGDFCTRGVDHFSKIHKSKHITVPRSVEMADAFPDSDIFCTHGSWLLLSNI